jgi:hypothetical protein
VCFLVAQVYQRHFNMCFFFNIGKRLSTTLFAHHVNKKITKRMMDRRPKKSRPSDIFRNNVNLNKCISKVPNAPDDYALLTPEGINLISLFVYFFLIVVVFLVVQSMSELVISKPVLGMRI